MLNITMIFGVIMHINWQLLFFPLYTKGKFSFLQFLIVNILYSWLWYLSDFNAKQSAVNEHVEMSYLLLNLQTLFVLHSVKQSIACWITKT